VRHARATEVTIRFHREPAAIVCRIRDNGIGFDTRLKGSTVEEQGFGLTGIRERVGSFGGTLFVDSAIGAGTELSVSIPVGG
jgi:signal transduction histidine kinase